MAGEARRASTKACTRASSSDLVGVVGVVEYWLVGWLNVGWLVGWLVEVGGELRLVGQRGAVGSIKLGEA